MSTFIPPTPAATKSAEQHEEPSEQDSFNHLLYKVLRLTSEQVQDLNGWMKHRGIPNVQQTYTSLSPMMRLHTRTYPLMTIKSLTKRMFTVSLLNP